jgi:hypothetical protein
MADAKITALNELDATPADEDLIALVDDPSGSAETKKMTVANFKKASQEYMVPIWAEEAAGLANTTYEWAFGNGANTASDEGIMIYVPTGWTCTVVAMGLSLGDVPTVITVELVINGSVQGANCNVTCTGVQRAINSSFTPVSISSGDYINFRTTSVSGTTTGNNQVVAWLRYVAS